MKKNIFSRAISVIASIAVLGTASMLSVSAKGIQVGTVEVAPGTTTVEVPVSMVDVVSQGVDLMFSADGTVITGINCPGALASEGTVTEGITAIYVSGYPYKTDKPFDNIEVTLAADAKPGEYPINVTITTLDDNGSPVENPECIAGAVIISDSVAAADTDSNANANANENAELKTKVVTKANADAESDTSAKKDDSSKDDSSDNTLLIVVIAIIAVLAVGGVVLFIVKKPKKK